MCKLGASSARPQVNSEPTTDEIRCRAYDIYCARNGSSGDALSDWLEAEQELREAAQGDAERSEKKREMALLAPTDGDPMC
jgi:hypothetical protein